MSVLLQNIYPVKDEQITLGAKNGLDVWFNVAV